MGQEQRILPTLRLIEARIREKLTVDELAGSAFLSRYHYQRLFRQAVGESVMGYVARRRMELAAKELAETGGSVLEIALGLGFDSHEGFSRSFRAHMGMSPREYRRRFGRGKERTTMEIWKNTGTMKDILSELRALGDEARDTARLAREHSREPESFYSGLWEAAAGWTEQSARELDRALEGIEAMCRAAGGGTAAGAALLRAVDETAFRTEAAAFQVGVTLARAQPAHREAYRELEERFQGLAERARLGTGRIAELMEALAKEILSEIEARAGELGASAARAGRAAARVIPKDPPYGYLSAGLEDLCVRLERERITLPLAEDCLEALELLDFSAQVDALRMPEHGALFAGIEGFRRRLWELREQLSALPLIGEAGEERAKESGGMAGFFLEAEVQKLLPRLEEETGERLKELAESIRRGETGAWERLRREAEELGAMGTVLLYICDR